MVVERDATCYRLALQRLNRIASSLLSNVARFQTILSERSPEQRITDTLTDEVKALRGRKRPHSDGSASDLDNESEASRSDIESEGDIHGPIFPATLRNERLEEVMHGDIHRNDGEG